MTQSDQEIDIAITSDAFLATVIKTGNADR